MDSKILTEDLRAELVAFEDFLKRIGFKRIHGSVYGLLVLAESPLSSAQIEEELELSQSAVSQALKKLTAYNAVVSSHDRERNCMVHRPAENTLDIVASVFRRREAEMLRSYKLMAMRVKNKLVAKGQNSVTATLHIQRFQSIIVACELGEAIISFIGALSDMQLSDRVKKITDKLPQMFKLITSSTTVQVPLPNLVGAKFKDELIKRVKGFTHAN